jgi:hypothetical protein
MNDGLDLGKLRVGKKPTAVSPFSTGGGGVRFELLVAVHYLIALLRQEVPRGVPDGVVQEVRLQQRNQNCPVDDIVVACRSSASTSSLYLQVKHDITFGKNQLFAEVLKQAWRQLTSKGFHVGSDAVGLAIGEVCNNSTVRNHISGSNGLIDWSRSSSSGESFYRKVLKFKKKCDILEAFEEGIAAAIGGKPTQDDVHKLLSHFVVVPFDFDPKAGRDTVDGSNALIASVGDGDTRSAGSLGTILYDMAAEYAPVAGEINRNGLSKRISAKASFAVPVLQRAGRAISEILLTRLHNRLASEKNSKKYIPDIFVEIGDVKDEARLFCHPELFLRKLVDEARRLDLFDLNRFLTKVGLPRVAVNVSDVGSYETIGTDVVAIRGALGELSASLSKLMRKDIADFRGLVPVDKRHIFDEVDWRIGDTAGALLGDEMAPLFRKLDGASARVLAIVSKAGQGKTNFVCNLAEHCLAKRGIPCAYFTGKELCTVGRKQLQGFLARSVYGEGYPGNFEDLLDDIDREARRQGTAGIILIDAINEHPDLLVFSQEIEELIEKCLRHPRIRVILTCRSEYFDARFGNLKKSSFADRLVIQREIQQRMAKEHRRRMVQGYFHFFNLDVPWMTDHARRQFGEDPFLLRMFCEAYGNPAAERVRKMGRLRNIRRDALFREYFKQKLGALKESAGQKTGFLLGNSHPYQEVIRKAIRWMVDNGKYADVPLTFFKQKELGILSGLVDEDILVRRDLTPDSVIGSTEVLNFTFDACRDFLLSDYLLNVLAKEDRQRFEKLVMELTDPKQTVAEGLQQYLFYASRYLADPPTTTFMKSQQWYETVFITSVFDLDEEAITEQDADRLKGFCLNGHQMATRIVVDLLVRYDPRQYPNANILTLFEMFDSMDPVRFKELCGRTFGARDYGARGGYYPIDRLTEDVGRLLMSTGDHWVSSYATLGRLMLYLWRMPGPQHTYPARDLFERFAEVHPATASRLQKEHRNKSRKFYSDRLWP